MASRRLVPDRIVPARATALAIVVVIARPHATNRAVIVPVPEAIEAIARALQTAAKAAAIAPRQATGAAGPLRQGGVGATAPSATFRPAEPPTCNRHVVRQASVAEVAMSA